MASFPVVGSAGVDDCTAGPGACVANDCGGSCEYNAWQMAWPYYGDCISDYHCNENTVTAPYAGAHKCFETPINCWQKSCSGTQIAPDIKDCGPPYPESSATGYCVNQSQPILACLNTATFVALCGGCNPLTYGHIGLTFEAN